MKTGLKIAIITFDKLVRSRHSREGGNPFPDQVEDRLNYNSLKILDSRLRGNDRKVIYPTFYETITFE